MRLSTSLFNTYVASLNLNEWYSNMSFPISFKYPTKVSILWPIHLFYIVLIDLQYFVVVILCLSIDVRYSIAVGLTLAFLGYDVLST